MSFLVSYVNTSILSDRCWASRNTILQEVSGCGSEILLLDGLRIDRDLSTPRACDDRLETLQEYSIVANGRSRVCWQS